jgi:hypothetical protein
MVVELVGRLKSQIRASACESPTAGLKGAGASTIFHSGDESPCEIRFLLDASRTR